VKQFQKFQIALRRLARIPLTERLEALEQALDARETNSQKRVGHSEG
jgi:hypothetical protein